jgi:malonyl CoA-acyl carrier protein transacylase
MDGLVLATYTDWYLGLSLGFLAVAVAATLVAIILALAGAISNQAQTAVGGVTLIRDQTTTLPGIAQINDSGVRILHSARALRKVAVGK